MSAHVSPDSTTFTTSTSGHMSESEMVTPALRQTSSTTLDALHLKRCLPPSVKVFESSLLPTSSMVTSRFLAPYAPIPQFHPVERYPVKTTSSQSFRTAFTFPSAAMMSSKASTPGLMVSLHVPVEGLSPFNTCMDTETDPDTMSSGPIVWTSPWIASPSGNSSVKDGLVILM